MKINTEIIKTLKPCPNRLDNWMQYYPEFNGDVSKFFKLKNITHQDKLWVVLRLVSNDTKVVFALDCVFAVYNASVVDAADAAAYNATDAYAAYADAYYADNATYAAYYTDNATYAAFYTAYSAVSYATDRKKEEQNQLKVLLYLIKGEKK